MRMKPEKKGQVTGGIIGALAGGLAAYLLWGFSFPGGIWILAGIGVGGLIGYSLGQKRVDAQR